LPGGGKRGWRERPGAVPPRQSGDSLLFEQALHFPHQILEMERLR